MNANELETHVERLESALEELQRGIGDRNA